MSFVNFDFIRWIWLFIEFNVRHPWYATGIAIFNFTLTPCTEEIEEVTLKSCYLFLIFIHPHHHHKWYILLCLCLQWNFRNIHWYLEHTRFKFENTALIVTVLESIIKKIRRSFVNFLTSIPAIKCTSLITQNRYKRENTHLKRTIERWIYFFWQLVKAERNLCYKQLWLMYQSRI